MTSPLAVTVYDDDRPEDAPRLVLVHGVMDRAASFGRVVGYLPDITVITYDRRGYARSMAVRPVDKLSEQVDDLIAVIDGRRTSVVGHSMGGVLALAAAQLRPELIASVGVYEPPMPWLDWWPQASAGSQAAAEPGDPAKAAERFLRVLVGDEAWEMLPMRTQQQRRDEGVALLADVQALRMDDAPFDAAALTVPAAVATGADTRPHHRRGTTELGEALAVPVLRIEGAGHGGHTSHPREFAGFCRSVVAMAR